MTKTKTLRRRIERCYLRSHCLKDSSSSFCFPKTGRLPSDLSSVFDDRSIQFKGTRKLSQFDDLMEEKLCDDIPETVVAAAAAVDAVVADVAASSEPAAERPSSAFVHGFAEELSLVHYRMRIQNQTSRRSVKHKRADVRKIGALRCSHLRLGRRSTRLGRGHVQLHRLLLRQVLTVLSQSKRVTALNQSLSNKTW